MAKLVHLHAAPEDERLRMVAKRAVARPGFPFDGLFAGAAMILAPLALSGGIAKAGGKAASREIKPTAGRVGGCRRRAQNVLRICR